MEIYQQISEFFLLQSEIADLQNQAEEKKELSEKLKGLYLVPHTMHLQ